MNLSSTPVVASGDTYLNTNVSPGRPGAVSYGRDGRRFRLVKAGAVALNPGVLVQSPALVAAQTNLAIPNAVAVGAKAFVVTAGAGALAANYFAGGLAIVTAGAGIGQSFLIKSHDAIPGGGGATTIYLESDEAVITALVTATSKIDLVPNPYNGVVITPGTAATAGAVGVTVAPIDAGNWGYVQVEGTAAVLVDGAVAAGNAVSPSVTVAGAVVINSTILPIVGASVGALATGRTSAVSLTLP